MISDAVNAPVRHVRMRLARDPTERELTVLVVIAVVELSVGVERERQRRRQVVLGRLRRQRVLDPVADRGDGRGRVRVEALEADHGLLTFLRLGRVEPLDHVDDHHGDVVAAAAFVGHSHEDLSRLLGILGLGQDLRDAIVGDLVEETIAAQQVPVTRERRDLPRVDSHLAVDAQSAA